MTGHVSVTCSKNIFSDIYFNSLDKNGIIEWE